MIFGSPQRKCQNLCLSYKLNGVCMCPTPPKKCRCGQPVALPWSVMVCSNYPRCVKEKIQRGAEDFAHRFTGVMKDLAEEENCACGGAKYFSHHTPTRCWWEKGNVGVMVVETKHDHVVEANKMVAPQSAKEKCCKKCGTQVEDTQTMIPCEHCSCHAAPQSAIEAETKRIFAGLRATKPPTAIEDVVRGFKEKLNLSEAIWETISSSQKTQILSDFRTTLTSFEATIRADEAEKCNEHIEKAIEDHKERLAPYFEVKFEEGLEEGAAEERTRIIGLVEKEKYVQSKIEDELMGDIWRKGESQMAGYVAFHVNAALSRIIEILKV